jgi:hypothetical protein
VSLRHQLAPGVSGRQAVMTARGGLPLDIPAERAESIKPCLATLA